MSCEFQAIDSREERQQGRRSSKAQSFPLGTTFCEYANTSLSTVSQSDVDIMDPSQTAPATDLETTASRICPHAESETKGDFERHCSGSGRRGLTAGGVNSQGNLATRTCHRDFHSTRQNR